MIELNERLITSDEYDSGEPTFGWYWATHQFAVNIESLWQCTKGDNLKEKEDNFVNNYSIIQTHEFLHRLLADIYWDLFNEREEEIVSMLTSYPEDLKISHVTLHQAWDG